MDSVITLDTSALIAVIGNEASKPRIIALTAGHELIAPCSVHWEVGNAFSAMLRRRRATLEQVKKAIQVYRQIPLQLIDVDLAEALELADRLNLYAYDAYLLCCARQTRTALITLDNGLKNAARSCGVSIQE